MPVVFEPQAPFSQRVAEQYGQNRQLMEQARMFAQARGDNVQLQQAELQARVQGASAAAETALGGSRLEAQQVAQARDIASQYGLQAEQNEFRAAAQSAAFQQQQQMAILDERLAEQQLTFREQQDLRQLQQGWKSLDSDVAAGRLTPDEAAQIKGLMGPKISRLMAQESISQQKREAEEIKLMQGRNALIQQEQANAEAFQAAQAKNAFGFEVDTSAAPEIASQVVAQNPALATDPVALQGAVEAEARRQGKGVRWYQTKTGRQIHPEDKARIDAEYKAKAEAQQNRVKAQADRQKAIGDFIANRMKPDALGAMPDFDTVAKEAEKYADMVHRLSMSPDERKEYDAQEQAKAKRLEEAKAQATDYEKRLAQAQNQPVTPATRSYLPDLAWLVDFHKRFPGGPAFTTDKKLQAEYNARAYRVKQAEDMGAGKLPPIPTALQGNRTADVNSSRGAVTRRVEVTPNRMGELRQLANLLRSGAPTEEVFRGASPDEVEIIRYLSQGGKPNPR